MSSNAGSSAPSPAKEPMSMSNWNIPHDVLLNCLARVPRLYYPTLSLVSRRFRSIIDSMELYETRSRLNCTEKCLYLCLRFPFDPKTHWSTLYLEPSRTIAKKSIRYFGLRIPSPQHLLPAQSSRLVAVGSNIFKIGGTDHPHKVKIWKRCYSSHVSVLDCRSHTWHPAPSMRMKRNASCTATLLDGKIYVAGGCEDKYMCSPDWIEVFDLATQTWGSVKNPRIFELHDEFRTKGFVAKSLRLDGKLYLFGDEKVVYDPEEGTWNTNHSRMFWAVNESHCVIDDVLFSWDGQVFKWYERKVDSWKELKGVEGLPDLRDSKQYCKMVDLGGKIGFLWPEYLFSQGYMECSECRIWCAEITLERRDGDEIWGKLEWSDFVLSTGGSCSSFDVVSASV